MKSEGARIVEAVLLILGVTVLCPALDQGREESGEVTFTLTSRVSVWSSPDLLSQRITVLEPGTAIVVTGYKPIQKYFQIRYNKKTGYIDGRDLKSAEALARLVERASGNSAGTPEGNSAKPSKDSRAVDNAAKLKVLTMLYGEKAAAGMMQKKVWKGMTKQMVIQSLGEPKSVKRTVYDNVTKEQWEYGDGMLLFFDNDILMAYGGPPRDFSMPNH